MSGPINMEAVLAKFPQILTPAEKQMPPDLRNEILRKRVHLMLADQQNKRNKITAQQQQQAQAQAAAAAAAAGQAGPSVIRPPQAGQVGQTASPRVGMQQPQQMNVQQAQQLAQNVSVLCVCVRETDC